MDLPNVGAAVTKSRTLAQIKQLAGGFLRFLLFSSMLKGFRVTLEKRMPPPTTHPHPLIPLLPHLDLPVVGGGLVKLLPQLERELRILEGALGLEGHLVALHRDDGGGFGDITHLPGGEAHACKRRDGEGGQSQK